ncbi:hypothetical protein MKW92_049307, partial [Papaver armeniacum]
MVVVRIKDNPTNLSIPRSAICKSLLQACYSVLGNRISCSRCFFFFCWVC